MRDEKTRVLLLTATLAVISSSATAQEDISERLRKLENRVEELEEQAGSLMVPVLFLFGVFCALWAQNTGRNAWLWFFLGVFLNFIALLMLLAKNSSDRSRPTARGHPFNAVALLMLLGVGALCVPWVQDTGRDAWMWFSLGVLLNLIAFWVLWATRSWPVRWHPFRALRSKKAERRSRVEQLPEKRDRLTAEIDKLETQWRRADAVERSLIENEIESRRRKLERSD